VVVGAEGSAWLGPRIGEFSFSVAFEKSIVAGGCPCETSGSACLSQIWSQSAWEKRKLGFDGRSWAAEAVFVSALQRMPVGLRGVWWFNREAGATSSHDCTERRTDQLHLSMQSLFCDGC
jgi:hypothetical protein